MKIITTYNLIFITFFVVFILIAVIVSNQTETEQFQQIIESEKSSDAEFFTYFENGIEFKVNDNKFYDAVTNFIQIEFTSDKHIVIPSSRANSIFIIDSKGNLVKQIKKNGRGPGEFEIVGRISIDEFNNLYLFDPSQRKLIQYLPPSYDDFVEHYTSYNLSKYIVMNNNNEIVTYSPYNRFLFTKIDIANDKIIKEQLSGEDPNFKIWLGRIQTGGIVFDRIDKVIYGLYPEKLRIYKYNDDLELLGVYNPTDSGKFEQQFPGNLDPYDYTQGHLNWWNKTFQLGRIFLVKPDVIAVTYDLTEKDNPFEKPEYLNIYDLNNKTTILKDVKIPFGGSVVGFNDNKLWVLFSATIQDDGTEVPLKIKTYKFNN